MQLSPRYDGPLILAIDGPPDGQLAPLTRQRRRMEAMLEGLTEAQWGTTSRCTEWTVRDVVAHLVGVNSFWNISVAAGLGGTPTRFTAKFDPAASPPAMVKSMGDLAPREVLDQFIATNDALLDAVAALDDAGWAMIAEAPPGHVSIRVMAQHALWDVWVHERDIAIPLGLACATEPDELRACLQYAATVSPALGLGLGWECRGVFALAATDPDVHAVMTVGESVRLATEPAPADAPCLRGDALALTEALSLRAPLPSTAPPEWRRLLGGLESAFSAG